MTHAVILSDHFSLSYTIMRSLEQASWTFTELTFYSALINKQLSFESAECLLILIDSRFHERYASSMHSLEHIVKNFKKELPVFILFEQSYLDFFASWLSQSTRIFQHVNQVDKRATALRQILDSVGG